MANDNDKSKVIAKIVKLFLEFLIAAVVAWFGASCVRSKQFNDWKCSLGISQNQNLNVAHHHANVPMYRKIC